MMDNSEKLFKTDDESEKIPATTFQELKNSARRITGICNSLNKSSQEYDPQKTVNSI